MNLRNYNIYFHTHTISGIIISLVLFVIFFAGSFAFFKGPIGNWQKNRADHPTVAQVDYDRMIDSISRGTDLHGRDLSLYSDAHSSTVYAYVTESKDTTNKAATEYFDIDANSFSRLKGDYESNYNLGEFMYRLHFLAQIPYPYGYYLAGSVAFLFVFALITGLLVHWQKIVSNFYVFRPWEKLKTLWTDLHTALGVISFPFMLLFAVTGAYFLIAYPLFHDPVVKYGFGGNEDSLNAAMGDAEHNVEFQGKKLETAVHFNDFAQKARDTWGQDVVINHLEAVNYGDQGMQVHVGGMLPESKKFAGDGQLIFSAATGELLERTNPNGPMTYSQVSGDVMYKLHFANYGGLATKFLYFLLGMSGCFVIVSGVMIWLVARDKNSVPEKKRRFNSWLVNIYLSVAMAMVPVTALSFIAVKIHPDGGMPFIYKFYFIAWLAVSILLILRRNIYQVNQYTMLSGGLLGLAVPVVNGIVSGHWFWQSFRTGYQDLFLVDLLWLLISVILLLSWRRLMKKRTEPVKS